MEKIRTQGTSLIDEYGRERIFYGINVCDKGEYIESEGKRRFIYEWNDEMLMNFKKQGYNIIRLGITWEAVEPEKGKYNDEYIEAVRKEKEFFI